MMTLDVASKLQEAVPWLFDGDEIRWGIYFTILPFVLIAWFGIPLVLTLISGQARFAHQAVRYAGFLLLAMMTIFGAPLAILGYFALCALAAFPPLVRVFIGEPGDVG